MPIDMNLVTQFGVAGLIFIAFMFLLKWVLKTQDKILTDAKEERGTHLELLRGFTRILETIMATSQNFQQQVTEAHGYQRAEHKEIMENQTKTCANLIELNKTCEELLDGAREQSKILMRINGEKH
jgi:hypothetical protein